MFADNFKPVDPNLIQKLSLNLINRINKISQKFKLYTSINDVS